MEKHLDFQQKLKEVHKPMRLNKDIYDNFDGLKITPEWKILVKEDSAELINHAANDLTDYFKVSMGIEINIGFSDISLEKSIFIGTDESLEERSFKIEAADRILILGKDEKYAAQGSYYLEDIMNLNEAPVIEKCCEVKKMHFETRTITSGAEEEFSEGELNMIAHAGMTAVDVFVTDILENENTEKRVNDLIKRASKYGLEVYIYPHMINELHPEDEGAYEYYDNTYGKIMRLLPGIKGLILVGESCEFPSKDNRTTGKPWHKSLNDEKPSPGWFPCSDYPKFIGMLNKIVKSHDEKAELVFWTYNWGYEEENLRVELIKNIPEGVTMMATFEMFDEIKISENIIENLTDYSIWKIGPGKYFTTESKAAKEQGIKMYSMTNTCGNTWDFGVVPFLPIPQRWIERYKAVTDAQDNLRLDGVRESHSYGYWPSFISEMTKFAYMLPSFNMNEVLNKFISRDYGKENLKEALKAFKFFSEGMAHCVSTNSDQWGPARIGPAYPLFFERWELIPNCSVTGKSANFTGFPLYFYNLDKEEKLFYEINEYKEMERLFTKGLEILEKITAVLPENKKKDALFTLQVAKFIRNSARTIHRVKRYHYLKAKLNVHIDFDAKWMGGRKNMEDAKKAQKPLAPAEDKQPVINELIEILKAEIENAEETKLLVRENSRLGYTKELGYACGEEQLDWKINMAKCTLNEELLPLLTKNSL